jgi:ketol-acid reductoisomerase
MTNETVTGAVIGCGAIGKLHLGSMRDAGRGEGDVRTGTSGHEAGA